MYKALYKILRYYESGSAALPVKNDLTLEQAQAHCNNPETSSSTCTNPEPVAHTEQFGSWFDAYTIQD